MHVYMHMHMWMYILGDICTYAYIRECMYICTRVYVHACVSIHVFVCENTHTCICIFKIQDSRAVKWSKCGTEACMLYKPVNEI